MASLLYRLGRTAYRRWPFFIVTWVVVLAVVATLGAMFSQPMTDQFTMPGIESVETAELQTELFPEAQAVDAANVSIAVAAPEGSRLTDEPYAGALTTMVETLNSVEGVTPGSVHGPVEAAMGMQARVTEEIDQSAAAAEAQGVDFDRDAQLQAATAQVASLSPLSGDERVGTIDFAFDVEGMTDVDPAMQDGVTAAMETARDAGLVVEARGMGMQAFGTPDGTAELIGVALALVILVFTFGSVVAAGLPIITAGTGLAIGIAGITAMTAVFDIPSTTTVLASMIGLAVGIDYALFILARFRTEMESTDDRHEAIGIAVGTAGSAVVFAGLTVVIALIALWVVGIPFLTAMGLGAAVTVTIAVLVALTLLPAVLGMLGTKVFALRVRRHAPSRDAVGLVVNNGSRWARFLGRTPLVWVVVVIVALGALSVPMKDLHLALPSDSTAPADTSRRKAADMVADAFGPGRIAPLVAVVDGRGVEPDQREAAYGVAAQWAAGLDGVAHAGMVDANDNGAMILIQPTYGPEDETTVELLDALRSSKDAVEADTGASIGITGMLAVETDVSAKLGGALAPYLAIVIGLAFLLLMVVFRSVLVPLTATLGFLLSVLATLGATVLVFQKGTFGLFPAQPIISFMPVFLIGIVFGLAMDYQVFLVTRVREARVHGAAYREAIVDGFRNSARVVTAAALIMTAVFAGFIFMDEPIIQSIGFALAVAVVFDAFVVRMVLIPALLYLMGDRAWWLPTWLDRVLPKVDIEGENLERDGLAERNGWVPDKGTLGTPGPSEAEPVAGR